MTTITANINKSRGGWNVDTLTYWDGITHPARTVQGASTLAWALYKALELAAEGTATVKDINVNGQPLEHAEAMTIIRKKFGNGILAYTLPRYERALSL